MIADIDIITLALLIFFFMALIGLGISMKSMLGGILLLFSGFVGVSLAGEIYSVTSNLILSLIVASMSIMLMPYGLMRRPKVET